MTRLQQSENPLAPFGLRRRQCDVRTGDHARKCQYRQHSGTVFSEQFHPFCHLFEDTDDVPSAMRGFRAVRPHNRVQRRIAGNILPEYPDLSEEQRRRSGFQTPW